MRNCSSYLQPRHENKGFGWSSQEKPNCQDPDVNIASAAHESDKALEWPQFIDDLACSKVHTAFRETIDALCG